MAVVPVGQQATVAVADRDHLPAVAVVAANRRGVVVRRATITVGHRANHVHL